ncbi:hypothetical protein [Nocardiopsis protaetiae]|uniref:hypothetical protein n=1 Tax=Nocardiopsis protaetiae TaxID=3382270 RepID=UPI00387B832C
MSDPKTDDLFVLLVSEVEADPRQFKGSQNVPITMRTLDLDEEPELNIQVSVITKSTTLTGTLISTVAYNHRTLARMLETPGRPAYIQVANKRAQRSAVQQGEMLGALTTRLEAVRQSPDNVDSMTWLRDNLPKAVHLRTDEDQMWRVPIAEIDNWSLISATMTSP